MVDDEGTQGRKLIAGLSIEGFDVERVNDADGALEALEAAPADLVLVDLMVPGLNGLDLARRIRARYPTLRIVLTSEYPLSERQLERVSCGANAFVTKPYELAELMTFLRRKVSSPGIC